MTLPWDIHGFYRLDGSTLVIDVRNHMVLEWWVWAASIMGCKLIRIGGEA